MPGPQQVSKKQQCQWVAGEARGSQGWEQATAAALLASLKATLPGPSVPSLPELSCTLAYMVLLAPGSGSQRAPLLSGLTSD